MSFETYRVSGLVQLEFDHEIGRPDSAATFAEYRSPSGVESFRGADVSFRSSRNLQLYSVFLGVGVLHRHVAAYTRRPILSVYLARGCSRGRVSGASCVGHPVDRAPYPGRPPVEHVGVDLRGAHVAVPQ